MKLIKSLPVIFAVITAVTAGTAIAASQYAPADAINNTQLASGQMVKADYRGHGERGRGRSFDGRSYDGRGGSDTMQQLFSQVDANGDGSITQEEVDAFRADKVSAVDTNGDGALSIEEFDTIYREMTRSRMVRAFQSLDADGDGIISSDEMDSRFGAIVKRMDRNGDGALSTEDRSRRDGHKGGRKNDGKSNCR